MNDPQWLAVHRALSPLLRPSDRVLAPRAAWPSFPCAVRVYDGVIALEDSTVLVLHKGRLPAIEKAVLATIVAQWHCLFANEVFVVFAAAPRAGRLRRLALPSDHLRRVHRHLASRGQKVLARTIYHLHLPKTGGTAVWEALSKALRSRVYYGDVRTFLAHPPAPGDYDLVGLHGPLSMIEGLLREGDLVVGLLRDPVDRFMSSVVHARRPNADPTLFTPQQRAMREGGLAEFLASEDGRAEAKLQSILLGAAHDRPLGSMAEVEADILANAMAAVGRHDCLFAPMRASQALVDAALARFGLKAPMLGRPNENTPSDYTRHAVELNDTVPLLRSMTEGDRRLFETVSDAFRPTLDR